MGDYVKKSMSCDLSLPWGRGGRVCFPITRAARGMTIK